VAVIGGGVQARMTRGEGELPSSNSACTSQEIHTRGASARGERSEKRKGELSMRSLCASVSRRCEAQHNPLNAECVHVEACAQSARLWRQGVRSGGARERGPHLKDFAN
jgi:hypothetical protein